MELESAARRPISPGTLSVVVVDARRGQCSGLEAGLQGKAVFSAPRPRSGALEFGSEGLHALSRGRHRERRSDRRLVLGIGREPNPSPTRGVLGRLADRARHPCGPQCHCPRGGREQPRRHRGHELRPGGVHWHVLDLRYTQAQPHRASSSAALFNAVDLNVRQRNQRRRRDRGHRVQCHWRG